MSKKGTRSRKGAPSSAIATEVVPIDSITVDPKNARLHPKKNIDAIRESLDDFGQRTPLVLDEDGTLRKGHATLEAARMLGWTHITISRGGYRPEPLKKPFRGQQAMIYALADNRTSELSKFDTTRLAEAAAKLGPGKLAKFGWGEGALMRAARSLAPAAHEPETPEPPKVAVAKLGEVWQLGRHRLICGDSFDPAVRAKLLGEQLGKVDIVMTDPPYAIYGSATGISSEIADDSMVRPFFERLSAALREVLREFGHAYVCCDWRSWASVWDGLKRQLAPKNCVVWDKGGAGLGFMYQNCHEFVGLFVKEPPQKAMTSGRPTGHRAVKAPNLIRMPRVPSSEREHNAAKPKLLFEQLIRNSSDPGASVLDLFCGSGTIFVAAEASDRVAFAADVEPKWIDVAIERWQSATSGKAKRIAT